MTMIKNLIFDFGNVLVSYDFMAFLDRFFGDDKEREEVFAERYISPEFLDICDREAKPFGEMIAEQKKQTHRWLTDCNISTTGLTR